MLCPRVVELAPEITVKFCYSLYAYNKIGVAHGRSSCVSLDATARLVGNDNGCGWSEFVWRSTQV